MKDQKLIINQIDVKLGLFSATKSLNIPPGGWIYSIRKALHMSMRQLGNRMGITAQSVREIEIREKSGSISLNALKRVEDSLQMKLIYGIIPETGSLENMIEERATEIAGEIVRRASLTMRLDGDEITDEQIRMAISEKAAEISQKIPGYLWD